MNYLKYIEHDAENLQFFLWFRDYCERFENLPASEKDLSPEWTTSKAEADAQGAQPTRRKKVNPMIASVLRGTDFADGIAQPVDMEKRDPFHDPSRTPSSEERRELTTASDYGSSFDGDEKTLASSHAMGRRADEAFEEAGMKWKPCRCHGVPFSSQYSDSSQSLHNLSVKRRHVSSPFTLLWMHHVS